MVYWAELGATTQQITFVSGSETLLLRPDLQLDISADKLLLFYLSL